MYCLGGAEIESVRENVGGGKEGRREGGKEGGVFVGLFHSSSFCSGRSAMMCVCVCVRVSKVRACDGSVQS